MSTAVWNIHLLGGLRVVGLDREITRFRTAKTASLLAYLAHHADRPHPREVVIEMLWPAMSPDAGRNNLSTALSSLRHQLEPPGMTLGSVIAADRFSIGLTPGAVETDTRTFFELADSAKSAADDAARAAHWRAALDLCGGAFLPGHYEEWVIVEQRRVEDAYYQTLHSLILYLASRKRWDDAVRYARLGVVRDPLREDARYDLVRSLAMSGQTAEALREYRECVALWERELGFCPGQQMTQIGEALDHYRSENGGDRRPREWPATPAGEQRRAARPRPALSGPITFVVTETDNCTPVPDQTDAAGSGQAFEVAGCALVPFAHPRDAAAYCLQTGPCLRACAVLDTIDMDATSVSRASPAESTALEVGLRLARALLEAGHPGQILCSARTAALLSSGPLDGVQLRDLGGYRLPGFPNPERVYEIDTPGVSGSRFPGITAAMVGSGHLPVRLTRFFGREEETARLHEMLSPAAASAGATAPRLVTLVGAPGCGKTRLAIEVASALQEAYRGAVGLVELAGVNRPKLIPGTILSALGIPASPSLPPLDQFAASVSGQPLLLVLDNAEHLMSDAELASAVDSNDVRAVIAGVLDRVPEVRALVTSRRALGIPGEVRFQVAPLPYPQTPRELDNDPRRETPERFAGFASVRLFVDRAQGVRPDFQITPANAIAVARVCERLEGIPLAIELAASRCHAWTPAQLLEHFGAGLDAGARRRPTATPRQETLREVIARSYELLAPQVQRFFRRLSVFRGGCTGEAARAVCREPLALDYLALLVESSLVVAEEHAVHMRYRMLEMIREFALEKMGAAERGRARRLHAEHFAALAEEAAPRIRGPEQSLWLDLLDEDLDNLLAAMQWSTQTETQADVALSMCDALRWFWLSRNHLRDGLAVTSAALDRAASREDRLGYRAGIAAAMLANWCSADDPSPRLRTCLESARRIGDLTSEAETLDALAVAALRRGDPSAALMIFDGSLELRTRIGDPVGLADTMMARAGSVVGSPERLEQAASDLARVVDIYGGAGQLGRLAAALHNWARAMYILGRLHDARPALERAASLNRELRNRQFLGSNLNILGIIAMGQGRRDEARSLYTESADAFRGAGYAAEAAAPLCNLAELAQRNASFAEASAGACDALRLLRLGGGDGGPFAASALMILAQVAHRQGDRSEARRRYEEALAIAARVGDTERRGQAELGLGVLRAEAGDWTEAARCARAAVASFADGADAMTVVRALWDLSRVTFMRGDRAGSAALLAAESALRSECGCALFPAESAARAELDAAVRAALDEETHAAASAQGSHCEIGAALTLAVEIVNRL